MAFMLIEGGSLRGNLNCVFILVFIAVLKIVTSRMMDF